MRGLLIALLFSGVSATAFASNGDATKTKHFNIDFSGAELIEQTQQDARSKPLVISSIKRVSNRLRMERLSQQGVRLNSLYRVLPSTSMAETQAFFEDLFDAQGRMAFSCAERNCGSSNDWANKVFEVRDLAGRDTNQHYMVGEIDDGIQQGWLSVYLVTNARRQQYAYLSFVASPPADAIADLRRGVLVSDEGLTAGMVEALTSHATKTAGELVIMSYSKLPDVSFDTSLEVTQSRVKKLGALISRQLDGVSGLTVREQAMGRLGQKPISHASDNWNYVYLVD